MCLHGGTSVRGSLEVAFGFRKPIFGLRMYLKGRDRPEEADYTALRGGGVDGSDAFPGEFTPRENHQKLFFLDCPSADVIAWGAVRNGDISFPRTHLLRGVRDAVQT